MNPEAESEQQFEDLVAWLEGGARSPRLDAFEQRDPERFRRQLALVRAVLSGATDARLAPLEPAARRRALDLLVAPRREPVWRSLLARLVPLDREPGFSLREGPAQGGFQALYEVEGFDIDLMHAESGELLGQVLSPAGAASFEGGRAILQVQEGTDVGLTLAADVQAGGTFRFASVVGTRLSLLLEGDDLDIRIEGIELPA